MLCKTEVTASQYCKSNTKLYAHRPPARLCLPSEVFSSGQLTQCSMATAIAGDPAWVQLYAFMVSSIALYAIHT